MKKHYYCVKLRKPVNFKSSNLENSIQSSAEKYTNEIKNDVNFRKTSSGNLENELKVKGDVFTSCKPS